MEQNELEIEKNTIAVVIPCFKVKDRILDVLKRIGPEISYIYVVDDKCPDGTGKFIQHNFSDPRVVIIFNEENKGVGGAVIAGYKEALKSDAKIIVKVDGDGQMDPAMISRLVKPILEGNADYTKGNRFVDLDCLTKMPQSRFAGNTILSFITKCSSGYWNIFDPTNGFTAIHSKVLAALPIDKVSQDFFFESDMLFRLNAHKAVVKDVRMASIYADEKSNLKINRIIFPFLVRNVVNFFKRMFYNYYLHDFNFASIEFILALILFSGGAIFGIYQWTESFRTGIVASSGTVMLAALPVIVGIQFLLGFLNYDLRNIPKDPIHLHL